jgi:phytoene dehydrogenase-like protein
MSDLDAIVIGADHNGLTCAAYLGRAGLRVRVLERRGVVGGASVTEEFHPGFRNSTAAYTVGLLQPKIIRDLKLHEHGLRIVNRRAQNSLPLPDGRYLLTGEGRTEREIAKFSVRDAVRYTAYQAEISRVVFRKSAGDMLDDWFDSDPIKAVLGFDAVDGNLASPYTPGSANVLPHHIFGEANGKQGVWGHAIGGMGAITQAMAKVAGGHGVRPGSRAVHQMCSRGCGFICRPAANSQVGIMNFHAATTNRSCWFRCGARVRIWPDSAALGRAASRRLSGVHRS